MLIPTEYGGTGSTLGEASVALEEIHASGCNGAAAHAQMYIMGSILRHGTDAQKRVSGVVLGCALLIKNTRVSEDNCGPVNNVAKVVPNAWAAS